MSTTSARRRCAPRAARLTEPGQNSPYRDRSVEENLDLFRRMRAGEFPNGARVLRAKIDMASGNINLRDPVLYRILHAAHPRTGTAWCIYPTYDFAHGQSDAIEGVTHSICTLEFEDHRPLYDWLLDNLPVPSRPRQYEFARLNLAYTVLSKRVLTRAGARRACVTAGTIRACRRSPGLRRRGVPPAALREFVRRIGVAKANSIVDVAHVRVRGPRDAEPDAPRRMAVLRPLKVVIENYPEGQTRGARGGQQSRGSVRRARGRSASAASSTSSATTSWRIRRRSSSACRPAARCGLRYAYFITCREVGEERGRRGRRTALHLRSRDARRQSRRTGARCRRRCTGSRRRMRCRPRCGCTIRCSRGPIPDADGDFMADLNPDSLEVLHGLPGRAGAGRATNADEAVQFERQGYFCRDPDSRPGRLVFNRTVGLRDTWARNLV